MEEKDPEDGEDSWESPAPLTPRFAPKFIYVTPVVLLLSE